MPMMQVLQDQIVSKEGNHYDGLIDTFVFLPAPKTWIEFNPPDGKGRAGVLLQQTTAEIDGVTQDMIAASFYTRATAHHVGTFAGHGAYEKVYRPEVNELIKTPFRLTEDLAEIADWVLVYVPLMLILINSPKIIGRQTFMPNRALEREATKEFGPGKFPLHAWTEIRLQVAKPIEIDDGEPHEAHLTGQRALHFVRAHIRIRLGQLEYVSAHWRGDPALGMKQSRYNVTP
jgi:hypothetical protein